MIVMIVEIVEAVGFAFVDESSFRRMPGSSKTDDFFFPP